MGAMQQKWGRATHARTVLAQVLVLALALVQVLVLVLAQVLEVLVLVLVLVLAQALGCYIQRRSLPCVGRTYPGP